MSKDDVCKVSSGSKHKERKPKKPHYIPRPWGKPYNYKCFQCPFTCMEKSHLYNHMKYSLCKNSLSLLIESDWPYKKGHAPPPPPPLGPRAAAKDGAERAAPRPEDAQRRRRPAEEEGEDGESRGREDEDEGGGRGEGAEVTGEGGGKPSRPEAELLMADMLSLEEQLLRARSLEAESHLKHHRLSNTYLAAPALLAEQWRLLASSHSKAKAEGAPARGGGSTPCYPPPPGPLDYQDPAGLNLALLGVGYPVGAGLFSYMNAALPGAAQSRQAQLAQHPFLASAAQLMHPAAGAHLDRALAPPRLYYPFLCEHAFGPASAQSDGGKALKTAANGLEATPPSSFQPDADPWKVPALRPGPGWASPRRDTPNRAGDTLQAAAKEGKACWGLKRTGAPLGGREAPAEKRPAAGGFSPDPVKNVQTTSSLRADTLLFPGSSPDPPVLTRPTELWCGASLPLSDAPPLPHGRDPTSALKVGEGTPESVAALLGDLSKALQEYQEAECKVSHLEKEDPPAQRHLWEHLGAIRSELAHLHRALERTARPSDAPLDLSLRRDAPEDRNAREDGGLKDITMEEEEEEEEEEDDEKKEEEEGERNAATASLESRKQSLDMLIGSAEAGWPSRTTKCEADSSVRLGPDRAGGGGDAKTPKRPAPPTQRAEAQRPH